uniref:Uncharacterized protein n=1 Tax=Scophthalmus maximus TaxID=52904 RepID=A0A8D3BRG2_SCOMX
TIQSGKPLMMLCDLVSATLPSVTPEFLHTSRANCLHSCSKFLRVFRLHLWVGKDDPKKKNENKNTHHPLDSLYNQ